MKPHRGFCDLIKSQATLLWIPCFGSFVQIGFEKVIHSSLIEVQYHSNWYISLIITPTTKPCHPKSHPTKLHPVLKFHSKVATFLKTFIITNIRLFIIILKQNKHNSIIAYCSPHYNNNNDINHIWTEPEKSTRYEEFKDWNKKGLRDVTLNPHWFRFSQLTEMLSHTPVVRCCPRRSFGRYTCLYDTQVW